MKRGFSLAANGPKAQRIAARNQAVLWTLFETGITVSELCALRVEDVDRKMGILRVWGKGGKERRIALGPVCLGYLLSYLNQSHEKGRGNRDDPLFHSENGRPLTKNSLTLVFGRLRKQAGTSDTSITPQTLRHSFAFRYLQTGGDPHGLQLLLGYEGMAPVRQYLRWYDQLVHDRLEKKAEPT
ncbi:hypothetical protein KSZ_21000 [Dictyobacter formicarum]|uniref:Tyr recombinase domain-containing protein n=2 Tax=Dictyobacter formicarum TaxID=2778368 RepID=A0ABQ3VEC4_9CHLR|nr:hypothetical protein KSZ_21000 [Dictyobacter formicarum]